MKESVLGLKEKTKQDWFSYLPNCRQVLKIFYD